MKYLVLLIVFFVSLVSSWQDLNNNTKFQIQDKIIVYGSDTCHYCLDTKAYLKERKIDFIYYDVDVNLLKQREMLVKMQKANIPVDNLSLPVIDKNGKLFMNSGNFDAFLKQLKYTLNN